MSQQRPWPAEAALARSTPLKLFHEKVLAHHPPWVCVEISAGGIARRGGSDAQRGKVLLSGCCEVQLARPHAHTASNTINQVTGSSLISYGGKQPETQPTQAELAKKIWQWMSFVWPSGFNEQVFLLCCFQCQIIFYS